MCLLKGKGENEREGEALQDAYIFCCHGEHERTLSEESEGANAPLYDPQYLIHVSK